MGVRWQTTECPDDEGRTHDKRDSGENYLVKFLMCIPHAIIALRSATSVDDECARRGVLDGEDNTDVVAEVVNEWANSKLRRGR